MNLCNNVLPLMVVTMIEVHSKMFVLGFVIKHEKLFNCYQLKGNKHFQELITPIVI